MPLSKDLQEFVECLNSSKVEYLVVGALAVAWYGFPRYSGDLDFLVRPSRDNAERVLAALRNKEATGRAKDRIDTEELRRLMDR